MALSLTREFFQIPVVTRTYTTACILTTAAVVRNNTTRTNTEPAHFNSCCSERTHSQLQQLQVITPFQLYFNPELIISRYQIWRLITSFFFFGSLGFGFLFNIVFLYLSLSCEKQLHGCYQQYGKPAAESLTEVSYRYCRMLEEDCFRGRTADFVFMFLFGGILITVSFKVLREDAGSCVQIPAWGLSEWSLHVLSGYSGFLTKPINIDLGYAGVDSRGHSARNVQNSVSEKPNIASTDAWLNTGEPPLQDKTQLCTYTSRIRCRLPRPVDAVWALPPQLKKKAWP
ncbi:uncharacterized protein FYW61_018459 isoform 3-T3 [Anableps anableps]